MIDESSKEFDMNVTPADGCYIHGLYFEGARWNTEDKYIDESLPKILTSRIPFIWLLPTEEKRDYDLDETVYECPVYKTSRRAGTLSTTGHSTNFVMSLYLPIAKHHLPRHWIKRGVAALT